MTRRLTLTMVAVVAGALLVASVGTLFVTRAQGRVQARRELGQQATRLARQADAVQRANGLAAVRIALRLEEGSILCFGTPCRVPGTLPRGLTEADIDLPSLRAGRTVTGVRGSLAFAAAPAERANMLLVVVLTRRLGTSPAVLGPWFLVLLAATLAVAAGVAANLGRRLTRPLRDAEAATRRIAGGDLSVRMPEQPGDGEELAGLAHSINAMAESLERSRGLERQFLLSVSHDLRTPLTSIRGFAETLAEGRAPDPDHAAQIIMAEARRLERLVGDLLELAKLDSRRFSLDVRGTDVAEVVSDTAEGFRLAADGAGVRLHVEPGEAGVLAAADPDRLAQVVANLLENALKFASGAITVGVRRTGEGRVTVEVDDDGPGIRPEDLPHVFEPFWRSDRAPARQVGTGLGLAIVAELVAAMGGSVAASPRPEGGTRVTVTLRPWQVAVPSR